MDATAELPICSLHAGVAARPCPRCGTFACEACFAGNEICPACRELSPPTVSPEWTAGFGRRAAARIIDLVSGYVIGGLAGLLVLFLVGFLNGAGVLHLEPGWYRELGKGASGMLGGIVASFAGASVATWIGTASFGKLLLGMRVVTRDTRPCSLGAALKRELAYYLDGLFFGMIAYTTMSDSPFNQRIGDRWAKTVVVRSGPLGASNPSAGRLAAGIFAGAVAHGAVLAAFMVGHLL